MTTENVIIISLAVITCVALVCYTVYKVNLADFFTSQPVTQYNDELRRLQEQANNLYGEIYSLKQYLDIGDSVEEENIINGNT